VASGVRCVGTVKEHNHATDNSYLGFSSIAAGLTLLPTYANARPAGGFHAAGSMEAIIRLRPGSHGDGTRWAGGRYYRGGITAQDGVLWRQATGAALGAASAYASCYQTQSVWNGYTYVQQTVRGKLNRRARWRPLCAWETLRCPASGP
jgi:hypothetical protein